MDIGKIIDLRSTTSQCVKTVSGAEQIIVQLTSTKNPSRSSTIAVFSNTSHPAAGLYLANQTYSQYVYTFL
jgi:hypothetical protein